MNVVERRKTWFTLSLIIIIAGLLAMPIFSMMGQGALNWDIEFKGGTEMHIDFGQQYGTAFNNDDIREVIKQVTGQAGPQIQKVVGANEAVIKMQSIDGDKRDELFKALQTKFDLQKDDLLNIADVSATISTEMQVTAIMAVLVASLAILIYVAFRFHDYRAGVSAVLALVHDVLIMLAVYSILRIPVNNSFIAAMLTIVGYSINDTIIVFDRIRENKKVGKRGDLSGMINRSVNQTLNRSINTSITTLVTIAALYIVGVQSIKEFALPLMVGIVSGTYSSIFIASPLWYVFKSKEEAKYAKV